MVVIKGGLGWFRAWLPCSHLVPGVGPRVFFLKVQREDLSRPPPFLVPWKLYVVTMSPAACPEKSWVFLFCFLDLKKQIKLKPHHWCQLKRLSFAQISMPRGVDVIPLFQGCEGNVEAGNPCQGSQALHSTGDEQNERGFHCSFLSEGWCACGVGRAGPGQDARGCFPGRESGLPLGLLPRDVQWQATP